ncbi:hypothetical protein BGZ60DRAFT_368637 [Tricladium varicosporioides]|nr:hypothetical protein BGZ60DRAFT_368637 [Hymenoscyphus varicosporioides]
MPVTIQVAGHPANAIKASQYQDPSAEELLRLSCPAQYSKKLPGEKVFSSFDAKSNPDVVAADNGFLDTVLRAYDSHHHLRIRPEDIWFTILVQLNSYINAHAEEMRDFFVSHKGQKVLLIDREHIMGKDGEPDFGKFAFMMTSLLDQNIKDKNLKNWVLPNFTTTTKADQAIASVIMMSTLQAYFEYYNPITCGIPSVTLLGEQEDWEKLEERIEKLSTFGKQPAEWQTLLKPVLSRFVKTFDNPKSEELRDFWQKICHKEVDGCTGEVSTSGWINAFFYWNEKGNPFRSQYNPNTWHLKLDDVQYHEMDLDKYPSGQVSVPVTLAEGMAKMVAGSCGMQATGLANGENESDQNTLQPVSGWWLFQVKEDNASEIPVERTQLRSYGKVW